MIVKHEEAAREAAADGAQIICFQELFYGPYFCQVQEPQYYDYTEHIPDGPTTQRFQSLAKELKMVMVLPMYEIEQPGIYYNTAAVIDADGTLPRQVPQAAHPAGQGVLGEVLLPARQRRVPDLRHRRRQGRRVHLLRPPLPRGLADPRPERRRDRVQPVGHPPRAVRVHLAHRAARRGRRQHVLRRRDQPGRHRAELGDNDFYGQSYFVDPEGKFVGDNGDPYKPELIIRELDMDRIKEVRDGWAFYRDRRPDAYDEIVEG